MPRKAAPSNVPFFLQQRARGEVIGNNGGTVLSERSSWTDSRPGRHLCHSRSGCSSQRRQAGPGGLQWQAKFCGVMLQYQTMKSKPTMKSSQRASREEDLAALPVDSRAHCVARAVGRAVWLRPCRAQHAAPALS